MSDTRHISRPRELVTSDTTKQEETRQSGSAKGRVYARSKAAYLKAAYPKPAEYLPEGVNILEAEEQYRQKWNAAAVRNGEHHLMY